MRSFLFLFVASGLLTAALAAPALSRGAGDPAVPTRPLGAAPAASAEPSSVLLCVCIDARGVDVVAATAKPALRYRAIKRVEDLPFQWRMVAQDGAEVATGGFDPGPMDLDPAHLGQEGGVDGDYLVPTETSMIVKVPALEFARIEFTRRVDGRFVRFGDPLRSIDLEVR